LFDLGHNIGKADALTYFNKMDLQDPISKLSAGPVHFAFTGWGFVVVLPESNPTTDSDYFLVYEHPNSFEADSYCRSGLAPMPTPCCAMNAGYSCKILENLID
jgi:hypothetical protein